MRYETETGRTLVPENHYVAMINSVKEKTIPGGFIIYEWAFEAEEGNKPYYFSISLFSSQMADLLRALGAQEVTKNKFIWDSENVVGYTLEFNIVHAADKKGTVREQLSDIKMLTGAPTKQQAQDIAWGDDHVGEVVK